MPDLLYGKKDLLVELHPLLYYGRKLISTVGTCDQVFNSDLFNLNMRKNQSSVCLNLFLDFCFHSVLII